MLIVCEDFDPSVDKKNKDVLKVGELKELERLWWIN